MEGFTVSFSESITASSKVVLSPNGLFLAYNIHNQEKLLIRDVHGGYKVSARFNTVFGSFNQIEWSSDSLYISVSSIGQALIQVFSTAERRWNCKIDIGSQDLGGVGLFDFSWSPNSRHLLTTASEHLQLTVWSLKDKDVHVIRNILPIKEYKSFSSEGKYFAVAKFNASDVRKKFIQVYDSSDWRSDIWSFPCSAKDIGGIKWSPDGTLLIWDSALFSNLYIYSGKGQLLKHYSPDGISLGIQYIVPSPTGQFIAFTNHKHQLRLMNAASYGISFCETLDESLISDFPDALIYSETDEARRPPRKYRYEITKEFGLTKIPRINPPKLFHTKLQFSWDGKLVAAHFMNFPNVLWVLDVSRTKVIAVLEQQNSISDFSWHPFEDRLCTVTTTDALYFWSPEGCYAIQIPEGDFLASRAQWNSDGNSLLITDTGRFTICYFRK